MKEVVSQDELYRNFIISLCKYLLSLRRSKKKFVVLFSDSLLCFISVFIAFSLRVGALDFSIEPPLIFSLVAIPLYIFTFFINGIYSTIFRFAGSRTIFQLAKAVVLCAVPLVAVFMLWGVDGVPRTIAMIQPMVFFGLAASSRVVGRYILMEFTAASKGGAKIDRVLIYGAGKSGRQLALSLRHDARFTTIAFVDDDERLDRQQLDGVTIYHSSRLAEVIATQEISAVLLALPRIPRKRRREIMDELLKLQVHVQTLPSLDELVDGKISINDLREIQIEDLLGRDIVTPNSLLMGRTIVGKTVLVSGAGGSIGSELCRQIVGNGVRQLILFDISEYALYQIERELSIIRCKQGLDQIEVIPVLGSVTDRARLEFVFGRWRPETVYHAAAYKHVPLVEANPVEGIRNNIFGTEEIVRAADQASVSDFILVSTDKAVRPTNIMGATKRAAEQVVQAYANRNNGARFSIVRFGNVLGSSGSVVPLFRRQIQAGGPITLTHRDVTRYFMTIPEAAQLVIQAGGLARGGEVFVLDMGKSVRIADLARAMVDLSGLTVRDDDDPDGDIEIVEIGLRSGEKLYEELLIGNAPEPTRHKRIMMAHENFLPWDKMQALLQQLHKSRRRDEALALLKQIVPEFEHQRDDLKEAQAS
ncbi:MAG: polysaccharide biosynthesis protein [Altererythrobacter sp.]|nr:polysaccharide biosynthesis protein [Altererythrobacter sp.]